MGKKLGSILILAAFLGVMLSCYGGEGSRYALRRMDIPGDQIDADDMEARETADDVKEQEGIDRSAFDEYWETLPERQPRVVMKYGERIFPAKYSDEVIEAEYTSDLSLLNEMNQTNLSYAYQDGKVYFRQYHEEYDGVDVLGRERLVTDGEKTMICVDQEGAKTELFRDNGWGAIYLMGERFYMTECRKDDLNWEYRIYSVDIEGNDRIDYGIGEIKAVDETRNTLILEMQEGRHGLVSDIRALDCGSGDCMSLGPLLKGDGWNEGEEFVQWSFEAYQDGWIYLSCLRSNGTWESDYTTELYAVSPEGVWQQVITLTSDKGFIESIVQLEVLEDRIFFTYGGYDGREQWYQGGKMVSIKRDGTDYRAIEDIQADAPTEEEYFYLRKDAGRTLLYYLADYYVTDSQEEDYYVTVWDVDTGTLYPSTLLMYPVYSKKRGIFANTRNDVFAMPDRSGRVVKVLENLNDYIEIWHTEDGCEYAPDFEDFYYRDGSLYFTAEYGAWSDGNVYHRMRMEGYRLKLGEDRAELLYAYGMR